MCAEGAEAGINKTTVLEARNKRGLLTRMRDFFADPALLTAYFAEHCATEVLGTQSEDFYQLDLPAYYNIPAAGSVRICINTTYVKDNARCAVAARTCTVQAWNHASTIHVRPIARWLSGQAEPKWLNHLRCSAPSL